MSLHCLGPSLMAGALRVRSSSVDRPCVLSTVQLLSKYSLNMRWVSVHGIQLGSGNELNRSFKSFLFIFVMERRVFGRCICAIKGTVNWVALTTEIYVSQFWRLEVWNQGVRKATGPLKAPGWRLFHVSPFAPGGLRQSLADFSLQKHRPDFCFMFTWCFPHV